MICRNDFEELFMQWPQITIKVMKIMGQKILDLQEGVQDFISKDVQYRLTHALLKLTEEHGEAQNGIYLLADY